MVNEKARCYMFWMIAGLMLADTSGGVLKLMYLPMLEDITAVGSYSWSSATLACLYRFLCKASQSTQNEIAGFLPLLQIWAWERVTVLRPQIVAQRDTRNIFPVGLPRVPHAARWFAHFSWTNTTKHVLRVFRDALDSMTEDQFIWEPYFVDLIESLPDYCRVAALEEIYGVLEFQFFVGMSWRRITRFVIGNPTSRPQQLQGYVPNATAYETMARHIHLMVNKAISLGDNPSMEEFYIFRAMVRDEGSNCLTYVQEADRINVQANYRRDEVQLGYEGELGVMRKLTIAIKTVIN
uniref:Aminotransferase-like plant mobile domain-containing protein n=1 Tax=Solanum tuberosum TaxID=4113 RepID=M1A6Y6_SOLTU